MHFSLTKFLNHCNQRDLPSTVQYSTAVQYGTVRYGTVLDRILSICFTLFDTSDRSSVSTL